MTRRNFLRQLLGATIAVMLGTKWLIKKAVPRKFVKALRIKKYPGSLKSVGGISEQSKWSG